MLNETEENMIDENESEQIVRMRLKKGIKKSQLPKIFDLANYIDNEAEEGSDNEEHDDVVKKNIEEEEKKESPQNKDPNDPEIEELINRYISVDNIKEEKTIRRLYKEEELVKDKQCVRKVVDNQTYRKKRMGNDADHLHNEKNYDPLSLSQRIIKVQTNTGETQRRFTTLSKLKRKLTYREEEADVEEEEITQMIDDYEKNMMKKISEETQEHKQSMKDRLIENDKLLENVVNLNKPLKKKPSQPYKGNMGFGSYSQTSVISALKNDKYQTFKDRTSTKTIKTFNLFGTKTQTVSIDSILKKKVNDIFEGRLSGGK